MRDSLLAVVAKPALANHWLGKMNQDWESSKIGRRRGLEAGGRESPELRELRQEIRELRRTGTKREPRRPSSPERRNLRYEGSRAREVRAYRFKRRRRIVAAAGVAVVVLVVVLNATPGSSRSFRLPNRTALAGMALGQRIVAIAHSQIGYTTAPNDTYCNKFSAYWGAGASSCPGGEASEEWCADFAAWAWQKAGIAVPYGYGAGDLNAGAISFYNWGVAHGTWHPADSGYRAAAGDVAVYGLNLGSYASAAHVAIVVADPRGRRGPDVINGDGDHTGFSVVEAGTDQFRADTGHHQGALLAGYVSP